MIPQISVVKVRKVTKVASSATVCDVKVAGNANLFVSADKNSENYILAHNCAFDVQGPFGIHLQQQKEADTQRMCAEDSYGDHYRRFMLLQMSNIIHDFSHMEQVGVHVDLPYLLGLMQKDSIINKRIQEFEAEFYALPSVKKANKLICERAKTQANGLFGKVDSWLFKFATAKHMHCLFFEVLELEPISYGVPDKKTGEPTPSIGKEFQLAYKAKFKEVELLERISKLKHLKSSFIEAFYKKVTESEDGRLDSALRPGFGFFDVVSGRSNSFNPSLQQTPTRTAEAKFIKRMFIAAFKKFIMKLDFSAHEVRCWSYAGQDFKLGGLFKIGRQMRMDYMRTADPSLPAKIKLEGDLHRVNVARFFKVDLKTIAPEELEKKRDSVKAIVFGAIYGRSVRSIAKATGMPVKDTQKSYDMFFKEYHVAGDWLKWASDTGRTYLHTHSFIGRKRNLWGFLTGVNQIMAANERQAMNSPIQGVAADLAHTANRIFTLEWQKVCRKFGWVSDESLTLPNYIDVMVHDSSRSEVDWDKFMACVQVANWSYTTGTELYYRKYFGVEFTCPLEIEFEFGPDDSHLKKWDWSWPGLQKILREGLEVMKAEIHPDVDVDEAFKIMYEDWEDSKIRKHLDTKYPWWGSEEYNADHGLTLA